MGYVQWEYFKEMVKWRKNGTFTLLDLESQPVPPTCQIQSPVLDKPVKTAKLIVKEKEDLFNVAMLGNRIMRSRDHLSSSSGS